MSGCPDCTEYKLCHWHERRAEAKKKKPLKRTPLKKVNYTISKISTKRSKQLREYSKLRKKILDETTMCVGKLEGCLIVATELHHVQGKENERLIDEDNVIPLCNKCHRKVTDMGIDAAIELGLSKSKHRVS